MYRKTWQWKGIGVSMLEGGVLKIQEIRRRVYPWEFFPQPQYSQQELRNTV
jgi:hypothetical protein